MRTKVQDTSPAIVCMIVSIWHRNDANDLAADVNRRRDHAVKLDRAAAKVAVDHARDAKREQQVKISRLQRRRMNH